ncbi:MAG: methyltetrahydrofolate cobalamin methyltransferase [Armatimonadetes bacterium]|nr:methyltetrahydrofolate cobalamin methyltransferase [Armatimonadota bacterium]
MLVVGELINSTRKRIQPAVDNRDVAFLQDLARQQGEAGSHYIDCNAATVGIEREPDTLKWLVQIVQEVVDLPCAIDSPNAGAMLAALEVHKGKPMINSITAEKEKMDQLLPVIKQTECKVIGLCMGDGGMPQTLEDRLRNASILVDALSGAGVAAADIYLDPLVFPVSTDPSYGRLVLDGIHELHTRFPGVQAVCGLSNVSYGLPQRKWVNRAFMVLTMGAGLDAVIVDPLDASLMALVSATDALLGADEFCMNYLTAARGGKFDNLQ